MIIENIAEFPPYATYNPITQVKVMNDGKRKLKISLFNGKYRTKFAKVVEYPYVRARYKITEVKPWTRIEDIENEVYHHFLENEKQKK